MSTEPASASSSIIVGIDEAGYGPLLGPLVVSAVAFEIPAALSLAAVTDGIDLWKTLRSSCCRKPSKRKSRLAVADSKLLNGKAGAEFGIALLERAALTFLAQAGRRPATLRELLAAVCPEVLPNLAGYPWYCDADVALPVEAGAGDVDTQLNSLGADLARSGVRFIGAWVEVVPEGAFNELVRMTHNKANVLFSRNTRLMQRIADAVGPRPLCFWIDRQGGRTGYVHPLMTAFDDARLDTLAEAPERSSYRLTRPVAPWLVHFVMKGETHHLPIALASIYSKYLRELFMICFNRYWRARMPDLRPTAGYTQDGRRFLEDIGHLIAAGQVDHGRLVRVC